MQQKRLPACEQAGLHYRHEVRAVVLARLQHHDGLRRVRQPIPVLADQRGPLLAWSRGDWSHAAIAYDQIHLLARAWM
jgi:hypothetical protein